MTVISEEIKALFYHARGDIGECLLLACYKHGNNYSFIFEKNGIPHFFCCDREGINIKSAEIPINLPDIMARLTRLEKENEKLKEIFDTPSISQQKIVSGNKGWQTLPG